MTDLDKSLEFYCDILGLKTMFPPQEASGKDFERAVTLHGARALFVMLQVPDGSTRLELLQYLTPKGKPFKRRMCDTGTAHIAFKVDDIQKRCKELRNKGVKFTSPPIRIGSGPLKGNSFVYFKDPDGITLELFQE